MSSRTSWRVLANRLMQASVPLLTGVAAALVFANLDGDSYRRWINEPLGPKLLGHPLTLRFVVNDVFMTLFFGLATREIVVAMRPGGSLHPPRRAANPIVASIGGFVVPALIYLALIHGLFRDAPDHELLMGAWAVPAATDIALVWLVARAVFGVGHPAVGFLLLLAIVDDLVGLVVIAVFYADDSARMHAIGPVLVCAGLALCWGLRRARVTAWLPYVGFAGVLVWFGLLHTPIHPSLALVPVIPFLPGAGQSGAASGADALSDFQRVMQPIVDLGLFFFGFVNAGVEMGEVMFVTWVVLISLVVGKTFGVAVFSLVAARWFGIALPQGMTEGDVVVAGLLASIGLTVSLFVAGQAFPADSPYQGAARMGALLSLGVGVLAVFVVRVRRGRANRTV